jgi:DNA-binding LacI/PurR family transcriptional regulator
MQLEGNEASPRLGYKVTTALIKRQHPFTAIFAFNDISAIGAIRALRESGLQVPEDVSVVGFDDIQSAAYQNPGLTTVRQPLRKMGTIAAETVLRRMGSDSARPITKQIIVAPELIVRETTCSPRSAEP